MDQHNPKTKKGVNRPLFFHIITLGCPKNTVDANSIAMLLQRAGYRVTDNVTWADFVVVNTCGFIAKARAESLETLEHLASTLQPKQKLIAAGCWAQRNPDLLLDMMPRLDAVIGTRTWSSIVALTEQLQAQNLELPPVQLGGQTMVMPEAVGVAGYVTTGAAAFLKISDGCSRHCAFCAIPLIKGPYVSRSLEAVLADAHALQEQGVLEINLIAQDSTSYGRDLGMQDGLAALLERMVQEIPDVPWIRILYTYPGCITPKLMDVIANNSQILPYIDIPLQHAHPGVLERMRRPRDIAWVRRTVRQLRERIPEVALRTTFIVGFPGETEQEFQTLLDFVQEMRFDRMGAFTYSHESGTAAQALPDDVPDEVKQARYEALMLAQQSISYQKNYDLVGQQLTVLLEGAGDGLIVGRSYRDAPEIDGLVLIRDEHSLNTMVSVEVVDASVYDLMAKIV